MLENINGKDSMVQKFDVKRTILPVPNGIKAFYCLTDGTMICSVDILTLGVQAQNSIPSLLGDLSRALSQQMEKNQSEALNKFLTEAKESKGNEKA